MSSAHFERNGQLLRSLFQILMETPEGMSAREVLRRLRIILPPQGQEVGVYSDGLDRYDKNVRFASLEPKATGWLLKSEGVWSLTSEGQQAFNTFTTPSEFYRELSRLYKQRVKAQKRSLAPDIEMPIQKLEDGAGDLVVSLEDAEEKAFDEIKRHLSDLNPYDFQDLVGALLKAMGYHVLNSPPGPDGGIDLVAYQDPLGALSPRLKVQVKRLSTVINEADLRPFLSLINDGDVGVFVNVGGFGSSAHNAARRENRRITLIDAKQFIALWIENYTKLEDNAREKIPLKPIWYLRGPEF